MRSRSGFKALGLSALVVGVMAIGAGVAQASTWMVNSANLAAGAESANVLGSLENNDGVLLTAIGGLSIKILCTTGNVENLKLKGADTTTNFKAVFTGCEIFKDSNGEPLGCNVHTPGDLPGTIRTTELHGLVELHNNQSNALDELATLIIPNNAEGRWWTLLTDDCPMPEVIPLFGTLALKDCEARGGVEQTSHLYVELPALSHLYVISDTPEHAARLIGSGNVDLSDGARFSALKE